MGVGFLVIGYCFPCCLPKIFVGECLEGGVQSRDGGDPPSFFPTRENPALYGLR